MCAMARQLRVLSLSVADFAALLRGEMRMRNFPADGKVIAATPVDGGKRVGLMVFSAKYSSVPERDPLPLVIAVLEQLAEVSA